MTFLVFVITVVSGPFGTFEHVPLAGRAIYWGPLIALALLVSGASCMAAMHWFPHRINLQHALIAAILFIVIYLPMLLFVTSLGILGALPQPVPASHVVASVVALACVLGIWSLVFGPAVSPATNDSIVRPRLYGRLPEVGAREIARITVQDHYVDVRLSDGSSNRLLMRFSDAVTEMDQVDGFCTHRSHWVAREAVASAIKDGTKEFVILTNGERVPVSKTYRKNLVEAGFLSRA